MDKSDVITLWQATYTTDDIGQRTATKTAKTAYCQVDSISRAEWHEAGRNGIRPEYVFTMFAPEYEGELEVEYRGKTYSVYRTYERKDEKIELYVEARGGVNSGDTQDDA